ncbi:probable CCR4-associated factor 1 homolog 11 [Impatiens glandulifera]|uniref:probable CCR4-associated factor 1 homolog 11 n=1 Tax=Impatiens glandulifera TaxID=253017 RepID=UPI001FB05C21|nr:probable CCR4-associated factor 1 homolog 11 [Impatiens glandulifera]
MANIIRNVWNFNVLQEFKIIDKLIPLSSYASFDTEFPGTIYRPNIPKPFISSLSSSDNYILMKANVDILKLIQVGLTLSFVPDPHSGIVTSFVWQFNINDFDVDSDFQNPDSIILLKEHGINFARNKSYGISSYLFGNLLIRSGLLCRARHLTWVTFHGAYDFGFLVKILTQRPLPPNLVMFMGAVREIFGGVIFDLKHIMKFCKGLYGGLSRVAEILNVERIAGQSHQAGSDSLLTMHVFFKLREVHFNGQSDDHLCLFKNILYGLQLPVLHHPRPMLTVPISPQSSSVVIYNV